MHEHIATPHYPAVIWAFSYRNMQIEITTTWHHDQQIYSAWVTYATGSAVAVPRAQSREVAIAQAKKWIQTHFDWQPPTDNHQD
ncbi:MAG: hypothetical protein AAF810_16635 [Cyanobacteria bacterium P01_D01_bin.36]